MKKTKLPGENISLKTKKTESELVMAWLNAQTNLMDSIRYLVECEISTNGVRNLQTCIPAERGVLQHSQLERPESTAPRISTIAPPAIADEAVEEALAAARQLAVAEEEEEEVDEEDVEAWS